MSWFLLLVVFCDSCAVILGGGGVVRLCWWCYGCGDSAGNAGNVGARHCHHSDHEVVVVFSW